MLNTNTKKTKNKNGKMTSKLLDKLEEKQNRSKRFRHMLPSPNLDVKIKRDDHMVKFNDDYDEPLNKCLKSFIIVNENENVLNTSSFSYSSSSLKMITCKICLNKFYDDDVVAAAAPVTTFPDDDENDEENKNVNNSNKLPTLIVNSTIHKLYQLESCKCKFCQNCLNQYISQCIENCDVLPIYCPDAKCVSKGTLSQSEIKYLLHTCCSSCSSTHQHSNHYSINDSTNRNNNNILSSSTPTHNFANTNRNSKNITFIDCENNNNNNNLIYDSDKEALFVNNDDDVDNNSKRTINSSYENSNEKKAEMLFKRYLKLYENIEILRDPYKTHCPSPHCQSICIIKTTASPLKSDQKSPQAQYQHLNLHQSVRVTCDKCNLTFCSTCFKKWSDHNSLTTANTSSSSSANTSLLMSSPIKSSFIEDTSYLLQNTTKDTYLDYCECDSSNEDRLDNNGERSLSNIINVQGGDNNNTNHFRLSKSTFENFENIKRCPKCGVLIERADGCAQIMCKVCKHTFCFYCLASLDNDFLLKHFTKNGPCKGKLGHSRFSLFMHRLGVVAIFSGTIFLVIILSPIILFSLPCLIFSNKCRKTCYKFSTKFS